ncbi:hypothetical protein EVAR_41970_1 [Eumeta japonica]|uniref:Uncharacterized protein n=1 Tax=Eumeta variegata TaxID=151549 RepID=A0A4C1WSL9_EUMVA|nr:hypothetical protein EVAR_41970_1 [Eumeta japonica]
MGGPSTSQRRGAGGAFGGRAVTCCRLIYNFTALSFVPALKKKQIHIERVAARRAARVFPCRITARESAPSGTPRRAGSATAAPAPFTCVTSTITIAQFFRWKRNI